LFVLVPVELSMAIASPISGTAHNVGDWWRLACCTECLCLPSTYIFWFRIDPYEAGQKV